MQVCVQQCAAVAEAGQPQRDGSQQQISYQGQDGGIKVRVRAMAYRSQEI